MNSPGESCVKDFQLDLDRFIPKCIAEAGAAKSSIYLKRAIEAYEGKRLFPLIGNATSYANLTTCYGGKCNPEIPGLCDKIWQLLDVKNNPKLNEKTAGLGCLSTLVSVMLDSIDHYWMQQGRQELAKLAESLDFMQMSDFIELFDDYFSQGECAVPKNGISARQSYLQSLIRLGSAMRRVWIFDSAAGDLLIKYITDNLDFSSNKIYYYFQLLLVLCPKATIYVICENGLLYRWWDNSDSRALNATFVALLERATNYHRTLPCKSDGHAVFESQLQERMPYLCQMLFNYLCRRRVAKKAVDEFKDLIPAKYSNMCEKTPSVVRKLTKILANSSGLEQLAHLISALEPYAHPSNAGAWSLPISDFFQTLFSTLMKIQVQSYIAQGGGTAPPLCDLGPLLDLDASYSIAMYGMMSKNGQISSNYLDVLKRICYIQPTYLTKAIGKLQFMMDVVNEPQSSIVAMRALSQLTPLVVKFCPGSVPSIVEKSVNSIFPSDPLKSSQALFLITMQSCSLRPVAIDSDFICGDGNRALASAFTRLVQSKIDKLKDAGEWVDEVGGFQVPERLLFELILGWGETAQFPQKMTPVDQGVITMIRAALIVLFRYAEDVEWMADAFLDFQVTRDNIHFASSVGLAFSTTKPKMSFRIFNTLSARALKQLNANVYDDVTPQISLLSSLIRCMPESYKVANIITAILDRCWHSTHKSLFKAATKLAQRCLESVLNVYPLSYEEKSLVPQWHIPQKEAIEAIAGVVCLGLEKIEKTVFGDQHMGCNKSDEGSSLRGAYVLNRADYINRAYVFLYRMVKSGLLPQEHLDSSTNVLNMAHQSPLSSKVKEMAHKLFINDGPLQSSTHGKMSKLLGELVSGGVQPQQFGGFVDINSGIMDCVRSMGRQKSKYIFTGSLRPFAFNVPLILVSSNLLDSLSIFSCITKKSHFFDMPMDTIFGLIVQRVSEIINYHRWSTHRRLEPSDPVFGYISKLVDISICGDEKTAEKAKSHFLISMAIVKGAKTAALERVFSRSLELAIASCGNFSHDQIVMNTIKLLVPPLLRRVLSKPMLLRSLFKFIISASRSFSNGRCGVRLADGTRNALVILMEKASNERVDVEFTPEDYTFSEVSILNVCLLAWVGYDEKLKDWLVKCIRNSSDISLREIVQALMVTHGISLDDIPYAVGLCKSISSRRKKISNLDDVCSAKGSPYLKLVKALRVEPSWVSFRLCRMGSSLSLQNISFLKSSIHSTCNSASVVQAIEQLEQLVTFSDEPEANIAFIELLVSVFDCIEPEMVGRVSVVLNKFVKNCKIEYIHDLADAITLTNKLGSSVDLWVELLGNVKYTSTCQSLDFYRKLLLLTVLTLNCVTVPCLQVLDVGIMRSECLQVREQTASLLVALIKMGKPIFEFWPLDPSLWDGFLRFGIRLFACKKWSLLPWASTQFLQLFIDTAFKCAGSGKEDLKLLGREAVLSLSDAEFGPQYGVFRDKPLGAVIDLLMGWFEKSLADSSPQSGELALDAIREFWLKTQFLLDAKVTILKFLPLLDRVPPHLYRYVAHFMSTIAAITLDSNEVIGELEEQHFLYLSGLVYSFPYSMREWMPTVVTSLSVIANESSYGGRKKFINEVIQDFFKTHTDGWNEWRALFTREQLDLVEMSRGRPSYFL